MLHLPLDVPRGLVKKYRRNSDGSRLIIYAYHFPGTSNLTIPPTVKHRPREKVSAEVFDAMRPHLVFLDSYDRAHEKGAGVRDRPTFVIPVDAIDTVGARGER